VPDEPSRPAPSDLAAINGGDGTPAALDRSDAMDTVRGIGGWLTDAQAATLWREARALPPGSRIVEIGSHQGRSTVMIALAAPGSTVEAIDPFVEGALFGGLKTKDVFLANLTRTGVVERVQLHQAKSTELRPRWTETIDLLYIDGKHDYWTLSDDLRWAEFVRPGGIVLIHDAFSSIGVTLGLIRHVLLGGSMRYLDRDTSLARFRVQRPTPADRLRLAAQLPWWLRNVLIKVGLRVARLFGNTTPDPY
jgi:predicted O-methyltransferase YrrM